MSSENLRESEGSIMLERSKSMDEQEQVIKDISAKVMVEIGPKVSAALKLLGTALVVFAILFFGGSNLLAAVMAVLFHMLADDIFVILW